MYTLRVVMHTERDIMEQLDRQKNKAGYIKRLIREDISKQKNKKE